MNFVCGASVQSEGRFYNLYRLISNMKRKAQSDTGDLVGSVKSVGSTQDEVVHFDHKFKRKQRLEWQRQDQVKLVSAFTGEYPKKEYEPPSKTETAVFFEPVYSNLERIIKLKDVDLLLHKKRRVKWATGLHDLLKVQPLQVCPFVLTFSEVRKNKFILVLRRLF